MSQIFLQKKELTSVSEQFEDNSSSIGAVDGNIKENFGVRIGHCCFAKNAKNIFFRNFYEIFKTKNWKNILLVCELKLEFRRFKFILIKKAKFDWNPSGYRRSLTTNLRNKYERII